jgi:D-tagatose-1,6-bisphosphate aldolase subunit GatZ/KbaZ
MNISFTDGKKHSTGKLHALLQQNRNGAALGIYSICSANRYVLEAGMQEAAENDSLLFIESTSNQVNQFGGYTGQTPADFVTFVQQIAAAMRFPWDRVVLGGDHLGPHVWRNDVSAVAMAKARELVGAYVRAGFIKIHLDASMGCVDDKDDHSGQLSDEVVNARAAELCSVAEAAYQGLPPGSPEPLYVIGTEVPIPGGERLESPSPKPTRTEDLARTIELAKKEFYKRGLQSAWARVIGVVVQPGVEFGNSTVFAYDSGKVQALSKYLVEHGTGVFEAHSTDYQSRKALRQMVRDHFAILKVGPWLTFAFREAVFALEQIETELLSSRRGLPLSNLCETLEKAMLDNPVHWKDYYHGNEDELRFARKYSYSDRSRYYWHVPEVAAAFRRLIANLAEQPAPISLLGQYLPVQSEEMRAGKLANHPLSLIRSKIVQVLDCYAVACGMRSGQ